METTHPTLTLSSLPVAELATLVVGKLPNLDSVSYERESHGYAVTWIDFRRNDEVVARVVVDSEGEPTTQTVEIIGFERRGWVTCSARFQGGFPIDAVVASVAGLVG